MKTSILHPWPIAVPSSSATVSHSHLEAPATFSCARQSAVINCLRFDLIGNAKEQVLVLSDDNGHIQATGIVAYIVAVASHNAINIPWILGKNSQGRFSLWSYVFFGPFLILARGYAIVKRFMRKESVYDMISEGLYLGGWPFMMKHLPPGNPSVIDCTCELPRSAFVPTNEYLCVPTWDTRAPAPYQIESAARWACEKRAKGKSVYVHCAFGHGRSACVMCAVLVALGIAENWKDAENIIQKGNIADT
ncbi:hypothetical protein GUJ93_ZPchr0012g19442 [Zizania palustris]|uniref:Tyrosine specific protein phosphatases domain-containing protein n=1 Tax=Zizania palustris TaxID=103762 RepID=A0A8J5WSN4_ZIZPA|nr:hypothetical protein GUJ93_ZPchr0012g19442 [Zizania palustris]